jgi:hypothetical protein
MFRFFYPGLLCPHHRIYGLFPDFFQLFLSFFDFGDSALSDGLVRARRVTHPYLKWHTFGGVIFVGVNLVLDEREPIRPVVRLVIAENP